MKIELKIRLEIFRAFKRLGADRELLSIIGSWGDTLEDKEALRLLKEWNMDQAKRAAVEALCQIAPQSNNRPFLVSRNKGRATQSS